VVHQMLINYCCSDTCYCCHLLSFKCLLIHIHQAVVHIAIIRSHDGRFCFVPVLIVYREVRFLG